MKEELLKIRMVTSHRKLIKHQTRDFIEYHLFHGVIEFRWISNDQLPHIYEHLVDIP